MSSSKSSAKNTPGIDDACDDETLELAELLECMIELLELEGDELVTDELLIDELDESVKPPLELLCDELLATATLEEEAFSPRMP